MVCNCLCMVDFAACIQNAILVSLLAVIINPRQRHIDSKKWILVINNFCSFYYSTFYMPLLY